MQIYREIVRKGRQRKKMQLEKNHPHNRRHALPQQDEDVVTILVTR